MRCKNRLEKSYDKFLSQAQAPSSYLTTSKQWLDRASLYSLNQDVRTLNIDASSKTDQIYYPLLNFFYHISLATNFLYVVKEKSTYRFKPTWLIAEYEQLNTAEKYFALIEVFWVYTDWLEVAMEVGCVAEIDIPQEDQFIATFCGIPSTKEIDIPEITNYCNVW